MNGAGCTTSPTTTRTTPDFSATNMRPSGANAMLTGTLNTAPEAAAST